MAELVLCVTAHPSGLASQYQKYDVICAFNNREIKRVCAETLLNPRAVKRVDGRLPNDLLLRTAFLENVYPYRFERRSRTTCVRVDLSDDSETDVSGEMDVDFFIKRRYQAGQKWLFGTAGQEIWYGGNVDYSSDTVDAVVQAMIDTGDYDSSDFLYHPIGTQPYKSMLVISTDDFTDAESAAYTAREESGDTIVRKRVKKVVWDKDLALEAPTLANILNPSVSVAIHDLVSFDHSVIVKDKPGLGL